MAKMLGISVWVMFVVLSPGSLFAQLSGEPDKTTGKYRQQLLDIAESYKFETPKGKSQAEVQLVKRPLFSWANPQRSSEGGVLHLWTRGGRPVATFGAWTMNSETICYELQSLSEEKLSASNPALAAWQVTEPGVTYREFNVSFKPHANASRRLSQLRSLVRKRMVALVDAGTPQEESLRFISAPLYRYPNKMRGVLDGAIFSFAHGTDPELLVIVELRESREGIEWCYAVAPSTAHGLRVTVGDETILNTKRLHGLSQRPGNTFIFREVRNTAADSLGESDQATPDPFSR